MMTFVMVTWKYLSIKARELYTSERTLSGAPIQAVPDTATSSLAY